MRRWIPLSLLCACAPPPDDLLEGSLADFFDLEFEVTRARWYPSELAIEYTHPGRGDLVVLRLSILHGGGLEAGPLYDLAEVGHLGFSDALGSQPPPIAEGRLWFDRIGPNTGDILDGTFEAVLEERQSVGLAVRGTFLSRLEVVDAL